MPATSSAIEQLEFELLGSLITPTDTEWDTARAAWNLTVNQQPTAVVFVADAQDVRTVIRYAASTGQRVSAQSTGHLASALGDLTDTVLIRTGHLNTVIVDKDAHIVKVGSGVVWGEVTEALEGSGLTALAGSSPDVGVVGYTLGGGYSWLARSHGLAASSVTAIEIVLASGELVRANAESHADLFWALRGGGGAFGIVTAIEFRVYEVADVYAGMVLFPIERSREIMTAWSRWTQDVSENVTSCVRLLRFPPLPELPEAMRGQSFVGIDGAIDASNSDASSLLDVFRALHPLIDTFARVPTSHLATLHMDPPTPVPVVGDGINIAELGPDAIDALLASAGASSGSPLLVLDIRHLGGAAGRPDPRGGSVDSLSGKYLVYAAGIAPTADSAPVVANAVASVRSALAPWSSEYDYSNFREAADAPERFWKPSTLARLRAIKTAVDPDSLITAAHRLH
jgi:FAD/FMN-containing dehydrogenase